MYRTSCRKSLPACILRVIASCVNSNHKHCNVNDIDTNHERSTSTRMETIARGEGLKHFMKTGRVPHVLHAEHIMVCISLLAGMQALIAINHDGVLDCCFSYCQRMGT